MAFTPLRIGIVGAGSIVRQRHLPGFRQLEGVRVAAVANSTPDSARRFIDEENLGARVVGTWEELANAADIDVVWVGAYRVEIPGELEVHCCFARGFPAKWNFSTVHDGPQSDVLTLHGSEGTLKIDFLTELIQLERSGEVSELDCPAVLSRPWQVERDFIEAVRNPGGPRPHPDFQGGVAYMKVVQAVEDARLTGARVRVDG